jgi:exodeoxyribonuclease X
VKLIIIDFETTGLKDPIGVVEVAWVEVDHSLSIISEFDSLVNPGIPIAEGAEGVHGISDDMVAEEPSIEDIKFPTGEVCLIGHNVINYDKALADPHMNIVACCDTLVLARRLLPNCENHQLSTLQAYCELPKTLAHRAPGDVRTVLNLLEYLIEGSGMSLIQLINYSNTPQLLEYVSFGKHKGKKFSELPKSYLHWMRNAGDWDIDITHTINSL